MKNQPKQLILDFLQRRFEISQRNSRLLSQLTVKYMIDFFSLIIFTISKNSKIQPFLSQKNSQNIQKTKGISSDPDSKHIGLPPPTNHSKRKTGGDLRISAKIRAQTYKNKSP